MSREALLAGISPVVLRTAAYYCSLGIGTYTPKGYHFDKVVVVQKEPFEMKDFLSHSGSMMRVEFWANGQLQRYIDFFQAVAGFSGRPTISSVPG